ncbi:MAG: DUF4387 domain-containing protein [Desulfurococcales archaeon]|nr:DUF4387 domain-containing protein [Desulfurococcales archaeon]
MTPLRDVAKIIRSKNAGPFTITIDIIFDDEDCLDALLNLLNRKLVAQLYKVNSEDIEIIPYRPARAVKINIPRGTPSGHPGDTDVYGAQQHAPLLGLEVECG